MGLKKLIIFTAAAFTLFSGCSQNSDGGNGQSGTVTLNTIDGKKLEVAYSQGRIQKFKDLNLSGYDNKIIFLDFFSTSCGPCRDEIPHLVNLQEKYKEDFAVIGILVENKTLDQVKDFVQLFDINYQVTDAGKEYVMTDLVGGVRGIPAMFMYDKQGRYFTHYIGAVPQAMIENDIKKILAQ